MNFLDRLFNPPIREQIIELSDRNIRVIVRHRAYAKLRYYTKHVNIEWGGLLVVSTKGNEIIVEDVVFRPQNARRGDFHLDLNNLGQYLAKLADTNPSLLPKLKGWAHSHHSMGTFWSGEDEDTFRQLCNYYGDYVIGVVVDNKGNQLWRVDLKHKVFGRLVIDNIKPEYVITDHSIEQECIKDIKENLNRGGL